MILCGDGVILDSEPIYRLAYQSVATELGYGPTHEFFGFLLGLTIPDAEAKV
jgi:beta-phosphoglucomutase-like phosphatase (HAD superfamily)